MQNTNQDSQSISDSIQASPLFGQGGWRQDHISVQRGIQVTTVVAIIGIIIMTALLLSSDVSLNVLFALLFFVIVIAILLIANTLMLDKYARKLQLSEDRYRTIVEDQPNFIVRWLPDGTVTFANKNYCDDLRKPYEDVIGINFLSWASPEQKAAVLENIHALTPEKPVQISTHAATTYEGNPIWHQWLDRGIFDEAGQLVAVESIGTDVTSEKMLEQQMTQMQIAKEREAFMQEFLGTITHDLKTPLSVMSTSLYLLQKHSDPEKKAKHAATLQAQIKKQEQQINDILSMIRLTHMPEIEHADCDVNHLIQSLIKTLMSKIQHKNITVVTHFAPKLPVISSDVEQIERLMLNLIENAINYTLHDGRITISTSQEDQHVVLKVADTGIGIPADELDKVFTRFYRANNTSDTDGGTGLGLAIVKRIVELHNGTITLDSKVDVGTTVSVKLPIVP